MEYNKKRNRVDDNDDEIITDGIINKRLTPADLVEFLPTKSVREISNRWNNVLNPNLIKGEWTATEDAIIIDNKMKGTSWKEIVKLPELRGRTYKVIRSRWANKLDPNLRTKGKWTDTEDAALIDGKLLKGWTYAAISRQLRRSPGTVRLRWLEINPNIIKGEWTADEDAAIIDKKKEGMKLAEIAELLRRSYRSLRTRWNKVLKPKFC